mgnify:CR=1 FL=1
MSTIRTFEDIFLSLEKKRVFKKKRNSPFDDFTMNTFEENPELKLALDYVEYTNKNIFLS